jgi:DNA modification methylase
LVRKASGEIIAGHTRLKAAVKLGLTEVPVRYLDLSEDEAHALALADNRVGEIAEWDDEALAAVLREMGDADVSLDGLGWTGNELEGLLDGIDSEPEYTGGDEDTPEADDGPAVSAQGEVYQLGPHRLLCGSCREPADVARLLAGRKVNLAFTSPPYAAQREYDASSGFKPIAPDAYVDWFEAVQAGVREHLAPDGSWFVNIKPASDGLDTELYVLDLVLAHARRWGWHFAAEFCWERTGIPGKPARRFKNQFEPVYQFAMNDWKFRPIDVRHESANVPTYSADNHWSHGLKSSQGTSGKGWADAPAEGMAYPGNRLPAFATGTEGGHSAAFPVGLPSFFVLAYTDAGNAVYDPFMGSGTTLIAAAKHGRVAYGTEISPKYCDVIRRRWTRWAKENGQDPGPGALDG